MKKFDTIQQLWEYCSFCPICGRNCRVVSLTVGPDDEFQTSLVPFRKKGEKLTLNLHSFKDGNSFIELEIDCQDNSYLAIGGVGLPLAQMEEGHFYFYLHAFCLICKATNADTSDVELDIGSRKVIDFQMEREWNRVHNHRFDYEITLRHDSGSMFILNNLTHKGLKLPLIEFDYSNVSKLIREIQTYIIFS